MIERTGILGVKQGFKRGRILKTRVERPLCARSGRSFENSFSTQLRHLLRR